tara:strand:- start:74 stop:964 length:891 start_codon:yes stop_codon:yes gene_type:complete
LGTQPHTQRNKQSGQSLGSGRFALVAALASTAFLLVSSPALAEKAKPLFEFGFATGGGYLPDYPAADESHSQYIALPYIAYRGKFLRSDEKGLLRGRFVRTRNIELDVSLSGSFSVDSNDNDARRSLPDLDYLGEIGPRLQITIARAARNAKIDLEFPVRAVLSTDFSNLQYHGVTFSPAIAYQNERLFGSTAIKLGFSATFATEELMAYFYEVERRFTTASRPAYAADAGYLGSSLEFLATRQLFSRLQGFFAARVSSHHGATNDSSPLFRDRITAAVGAGLVLSIFRSKRKESD